MSHLNGPNAGDWSVFAEQVVEERDQLREQLAAARNRLDDLRNRLVEVVALLPESMLVRGAQIRILRYAAAQWREEFGARDAWGAEWLERLAERLAGEST